MDKKVFTVAQGLLVPLFTFIIFMAFSFPSWAGVSITVDNTSPQVTIQSPVGNVPIEDGKVNVSVRFYDGGSGFRSLEAEVDGQSLSLEPKQEKNGIWLLEGKFSAETGTSYSLTVEGVDKAGNRATDSSAFTPVNTDTEVTWVSPKEGDWVSGEVQLKLQVTSYSYVDHIDLYLDNKDTGKDFKADGSNYTLTWDSSSASKGGHSLKAYVYEVGGGSYGVSIFIGVEKQGVIPLNLLFISLGIAMVVSTPISAYTAMQYSKEDLPF